MEKNKQTQKTGDNSTSFQVGRDMLITHGVTYTEAKEIALDVFKSNFHELSKQASEIAKNRAEELTDKFLSELEKKDPSSINQMKQPDMQYALFTAQKEYARTGEQYLLDVLVDLLVDRSTIEERSLMQIVLNESLEVVPKLTNAQLNILSIVFILRYTRRLNFRNIGHFKDYLLNTIIPFTEGIPQERSNFQHLEYAGCGAISVVDVKLEKSFKDNYPGMFSKGFTIEEFENVLNSNISSLDSNLLIPCFHNKELYQIRALNDDQLKETCKKVDLNEEYIKKMQNLQNSKIMSQNEIKKYLEDLDPAIKDLFNIWDETYLNKMTLTSVGIALAHANLRRKIDDQYNLSIWI